MTENAKNYSIPDNYVESETGENLINTITGEVRKSITVVIPDGSRIFTPEQQEAIERKKKNTERRYWRRQQNDELAGRKGFYFIPNNTDFEGLSPSNVTRLIFLNTFLDYETGLLLESGKAIKRKDLQRLLKLSRPTVNDFWDEVSPYYLSQTADGALTTNAEIFKRGKLKGQNELYRKFYNNGIRTLYEMAFKKCTHLGYLFMLLPYVNIQFNVLCDNPLEDELDKVNFLTVKEFCERIGYDYNHISRLASIYRHITFDVNGRQERFCSFVTDGVDLASGRIFINPHILYSGTNYLRVEILGEFCKN